MRLAAILGIVVVCAGAVPATAQTLGDVARREAERRKTIKSSGKVITNESLRRELPPAGSVSTPAPAAPAPAAATPPAPGSAPAAGTPAAGAPATAAAPPAAAGAPAPAAAAAPPANDEASWRKRVTDARDALSRSQIFAEALQTRINALSTDFVNRDDPAQRNTIAAERQKALAELDRVKQDIQNQQKAITTIQEEARKAGVPAGWVR
jgi:hypothetical protein